MEITIAANNIVKSFGGKKVLDGISFHVRRGQIFGLLGPSGAGKTTLIKILTGQLGRDLGTAEINGISADRLTGGDHKKIGIMMDHFGVYERLNCYENLKIFAEIYDVKNDGILNALKKVGLEDAKKTSAAKLSKGMRSRLRLARFIFSMIVGIIMSEMIGAVIGIFCKNQMAATSLTIPVMMIFSFVPMLSMFNESIKKFAVIIYSQQISDLINGIGVSGVSVKSIIIIAANFMAVLGLFAAAYKKKGLT